MTGSEISSCSAFTWVQCFQLVQFALEICRSKLFYLLQTKFASWSNNYLDFQTLLLVFSYIIVYYIIKKCLWKRKIKLFIYKINLGPKVKVQYSCIYKYFKQEMFQKHLSPPWCKIQVYLLCRSTGTWNFISRLLKIGK